MARFVNSLNKGLETGYGFANKNKTAYERYIEEHYGPGVTSHRDPIALARAAAGAVGGAVGTAARAGAGFFGHAAAGLVGMPQGPSRNADTASGAGSRTLEQQLRSGIGSDRGAVSGITPSNRLYEGNPGTGAGVSAYNPGSSRQGMQGVLDAISRAEGTTKNGYNEVMGYGKYGGYPSRPLTEMTLQEVHDFGRGPMFSAQRAKGIPENKLSSAAGKFQITGDNIKDLSTRWGLNMKTTKFTPELQDKMALQILKEQGLTAWEGFKTNPKLKQQAIAAMQGKGTSTSGDPQVAQLQQSLKAAGAKIDVDGIMGPQTRKAMADYPDTAMAYTSTGATTTPALQAAAAQAAGQPSRSGNITRSGEDVAAMQRDLNSRGAKLIVDGKEGPLTRAAAQQFYGSPTSVRTPSFTSTPTTPANNWSSLQGRGVSAVNPRQDYVPTGSFTRTPQPSSYTSGRGDEGRGVPSPLSAQPRTVQTVAVDASGYPPVNTGNFAPQGQYPAMRTPIPTQEARVPQARPVGQNQWSQLQGPYTNSTGGANAIQGPVPRTPQPAPTRGWSQLQQPYPIQQAPVIAPAVTTAPLQWSSLQRPLPAQQAVPAPEQGTMLQQLQQQLQRAADIAGQIGGQARDALGQGMRSSMGAGQSYSGSGGRYSGGNYGGSGGSRITEGVGGAYRNR